MKKSLLLIALFVSLISFVYAQKAHAINICSTGKTVAIHYKKFDNDYEGAGVWTWSNGTNGSANGITQTGMDDFGAISYICVDAGAPTTGNFIPIRANMPADTNTFPGDQYKASYQSMTLTYDRSALMNNTVSRMDLYFIDGNDRVFQMGTEAYPAYNKAGFGTITVVYFDTSSIDNTDAYSQWELNVSNTGTNGTVGSDPLQWNYISSEGYKMKIAVINVASDQVNTTEEPGIGFQVVNFIDSSEKTTQSIYIDPSDVRGSGDQVVYYTANAQKGLNHVATSYEDFMTDIQTAFANSFIGFDSVEMTGTYAIDLQHIQAVIKNSEATSTIATKLTLKTADGSIVPTTITPVNEVDGLATTFNLETSSNLDKTIVYNLCLNNDEAIIKLNLDNNAPNISYTNNVKLNPDLYDEVNNTFLIQKGDVFKLDDYLRINILDDRDGNLTNQAVITGTPNTKNPGVYTLTISATDSWNNTVEKSFTFTVVGEKTTTHTTIYIISGVVGALLIGGAVTYFVRKH